MPRLNYHHLHYFWRVANEGNLTRAAEKLHVSQSALSSQLRQFEEATGTTLFDRTGRRLVLTDVGRRMLTFANDIFSRGQELEEWLRHGARPGARIVRIGMLSTLSRNFVDRLITPLLFDDETSFVLQSGSLDDLLQDLARHRLDAALTNSDVRGGDDQLWESRLLAREQVSVVGPPARLPNRPFPQGYREMPWVVPTRESEVRRAFEGFCSAHQFAPDVVAESNDMAMLRLLARDSGACAVLPLVVVRDEMRQGTLMEYLALPDIHESFYAITVRRIHPPEVLQELFAGFSMYD